jgi:hypothetical protein
MIELFLRVTPSFGGGRMTFSFEKYGQISHLQREVRAKPPKVLLEMILADAVRSCVGQRQGEFVK